jgi:ABC-type uncharacterized transport system permease subunit
MQALTAICCEAPAWLPVLALADVVCEFTGIPGAVPVLQVLGVTGCGPV